MEPVVVVGAGISGIACARSLRAAGVAVSVLDRGRRVGGRMAVRTLEGRPVDIGASYLTASDPGFQAVVDDWSARGLAHPWTNTFAVLQPGSPTRSTTGPTRWGAPGGLRSLVEDLATGLDVTSAPVSGVGAGPTVDGRPARAVVLAMPDPQARRLLGPGLDAEAAALGREYEPVLALTAGWDRRVWDRPPLDGAFGDGAFEDGAFGDGAFVDGAFVNGDHDLGWVADDGRRRGDGAAVLVAHSTPDLAARHLDDPDGAAAPMTQSLLRLLGIDTPPRWTHLHRWTFARPLGEREQPYLLTDNGIGACGDGWGPKPRVEAAYLSGVALADALVARFGDGQSARA